MNYRERTGKAAAQAREQRDPAEKQRPLPWFVVMLIGAMAMWGVFYIYEMRGDLGSQYGDSRTAAALMPPATTHDGAVAAAIDGGRCSPPNVLPATRQAVLEFPACFPRWRAPNGCWAMTKSWSRFRFTAFLE